MLGSTEASVYFGCSACGACCNSAPRLLLPELFRHQARFVGCLGIERRGAYLQLFLHGFSFASAAACPALEAGGACALHGEHKPGLCRLVPLDPERPDSEQGAVLSARSREAASWGAGCIRGQAAEGFRELTRHLRVVDPESEALLAEYRLALGAERRFWRDATSASLAGEPGLARLPANTALSLSPVPALAFVASASRRCHERVHSFVRAQNELAARLIEAALARKRREDRADTALLRRLLTSGRAFEAALLRPWQPRRDPGATFVAELELWLGI